MENNLLNPLVYLLPNALWILHPTVSEVLTACCFRGCTLDHFQTVNGCLDKSGEK